MDSVKFYKQPDKNKTSKVRLGYYEYPTFCQSFDAIACDKFIDLFDLRSHGKHIGSLKCETHPIVCCSYSTEYKNKDQIAYIDTRIIKNKLNFVLIICDMVTYTYVSHIYKNKDFPYNLSFSNNKFHVKHQNNTIVIIDPINGYEKTIA